MLKKLKNLFLLPGLVVLGFASKYYRGPFYFWVNNSLGGVFYVIFWCVFFDTVRSLFRLKVGTGKICIWVLVITCLLEFLQLVKAAPLVQIRSTYLGKILIGNTFMPSDFIYYFVGAFLAWLLLKKMQVN